MTEWEEQENLKERTAETAGTTDEVSSAEMPKEGSTPDWSSLLRQEPLPEEVQDRIQENAAAAEPDGVSFDRGMSYSRFLTELAPTLKKEMLGTAILCYACAALNILVTVFLYGIPVGAIDGILLIGLTLGFHLSSLPNLKFGFAIAILVLALLEFFVGLINTGLPNAWLWVVGGVLATFLAFRGRKLYAYFRENGKLPQS